MKRHDRHNKNTLNNRLLQLCVLSCILFIQKSSSIFHTDQSCDRIKFEMSAAQKKKKKVKKKMHLGQVFQSVTIFETEKFFSLALSRYWYKFCLVMPKNVPLGKYQNIQRIGTLFKTKFKCRVLCVYRVSVFIVSFLLHPQTRGLSVTKHLKMVVFRWQSSKKMGHLGKMYIVQPKKLIFFSNSSRFWVWVKNFRKFRFLRKKCVFEWHFFCGGKGFFGWHMLKHKGSFGVNTPE